MGGPLQPAAVGELQLKRRMLDVEMPRQARTEGFEHGGAIRPGLEDEAKLSPAPLRFCCPPIRWFIE